MKIIKYYFLFSLLILMTTIGCQGEKLDASEILSKSIEAFIEAESVVYEINIDRSTTLPGIETIPMNLSVKTKTMREPLTSETTIKVDVAGIPPDFLVFYQTDNHIYGGRMDTGWSVQEINEENIPFKTFDDPFLFIKMLKEVGIEEKVKIEKKEEYYLLTFTDVDGEFANHIKKQFENQMKTKFLDNPELEEYFDETIVSDIKYIVSLDNVTLLPIEANFTVTLETELMGETVGITQKTNIKYLSFNDCESIIIPQEVIDDAVPTEALILKSHVVPSTMEMNYMTRKYFNDNEVCLANSSTLYSLIEPVTSYTHWRDDNIPIITSLALTSRDYHAGFKTINSLLTYENLTMLYLSLSICNNLHYIVGGIAVIMGAPVSVPALLISGVVISVSILLVGREAEKRAVEVSEKNKLESQEGINEIDPNSDLHKGVSEPPSGSGKPDTPRITHPKDGQVFDHYPRALRIYWVESGMFENTYQIQVHYRYREGHWNEDYYEGTSFTFGIILHSFVGKNEGRCRVRAINEDGIAGEWSEWVYFRFTR